MADIFGTIDGIDWSSVIKIKGKNSICSTCKNFNGETCAKKRSFAGFATKLSDCNEWEVCNGTT